MTTLIISNEKMNDIMEKVPRGSSYWLKTLDKQPRIKQKKKKKKGEQLAILLGTLGASLLENLLTGKDAKQSNSCNIPGRGVMRAGKGTIKAGQDFNATSFFD